MVPYSLFESTEKIPQGIKTSDREVLLELNYAGIEFPVSVKDYAELGWKNTININVFGYENKQFYPIYVSKKCNEDVLMNLLLITKDEKKHYVLIKDVNSLIRPNTRRKSIFACTVSNVLAAKRYSQARDQLYDYQR